MVRNPKDSIQDPNLDRNGDASASPSSSHGSGNAELAQALRELARGEQAASNLEANLSSLEGKLDELLAAFEAVDRGAAETPRPSQGEKNDEKKA